MATLIEYGSIDIASKMGIGPFDLRLDEDGGIVSRASITVGLGNREIENICASLSMVHTVSYSDRLDYLAAPAYNCVSASCFEGLLNLEIPERARYIRVILIEINRIYSHLDFFSKISRMAGQIPLANYCIREKERFSDLFEMYCGSRVGFGSICIGGVREDASDGWLFRVERALQSAIALLESVDTLLLTHPHFKERTTNLLYISKQEADIWGMTGPNAKASGKSNDVRNGSDPGIYAGLIPAHPIKTIANGDTWARVKYRIEDIQYSIKIIESCFGKIPSGNFRIRVGVDVKTPAGRVFKSIEGPRGRISMLLESDGNQSLVRYFTPSSAIIRVLPEFLRGILVDDILMAIQSLDLSISEVDK